MNDKERLQYINKELNAIIAEFKPGLNELLFLKDCLKKLTGICAGEDFENIS